jgi:superfamily I DNA/RNA helicase/RecB family exonuclease
MRWELEVTGRSAGPFVGACGADPAQEAALGHSTGPLLVLGAAGSGKTRTLVRCVAARIAAGVAPESILVLTFGKRAVREFREALAPVVEGATLPLVATFHSLAFSLLTSSESHGSGSSDPYVLLSGAEEDARIREIIRGLREDSAVDWPESLVAASGTSTFAREMRAVIARLKELGMSGADLVRIGELEERPEWVAAGLVASHESDLMDLENTIDYQELVIRARALAADSPALRSLTHLFIDELQEVPPLSYELLQELVAAGNSGAGVSEFVAAGNPDESVFTFRGAQTSLLDRFAHDFSGATQIELRKSWRNGATISSAAQCVYPQGPTIAVTESVDITPDTAVIQRYGNRNARAAFLAQEIRSAHIEHGVGWRNMAVIGRASSDIPAITRALSREGVPVVVATDDIALKDEPAVSELLNILWIATNPSKATSQAVHDLLVGPMCGLDARDLRQLGRALRALDRTQSSREAIRQLIVDGAPADIPASLAGRGSSMDSDIAAKISRAQGLIAAIRQQVSARASVPDLLWLAWTGGPKYAHGWPERLRASALAHNPHAHHDLDAIMALFDTAERYASRVNAGLSGFLHSLAAQSIPAEPVAARGLRADAVQVMTVHQSKGQQWERVWITGLEEGIWPNLVARGSVLHPDEITPEGVGAGANAVALMREERNLFYVAASRAIHQVVFTCIDQGAEGGDQPSRFIHDLARANIPEVTFTGFPRSRATWSGLAAELRTTLADPHSSQGLRVSAGSVLASMGSHVGPENWWGLAPLTESATPIRPVDQPLHMSGSSLDSLIACPLKWFLDKEVKAQSSRSASAAFGSIVHAVAEYVAKGQVPADSVAMNELINSAWHSVEYESPWQSASELIQARAAAARFLKYHNENERTFIQAEGALNSLVSVNTPSGSIEQIALTGYVDRIERDGDGGLWAIDLKNVKSPPANSEIPEFGQLGVYQVLLQDQQPELPAGGAALVQLRVDTATGDPKVQMQEAINFGEFDAAEVSSEESANVATSSLEGTWIGERLGQAAEIIRTENFIPIVGKQCDFCSFHDVCPTKTQSIFNRRQVGDDDD